MTATELETRALTEPEDGPGWTSRWLREDPVRTVALLLIIVQLLWRAKIASNGFLAQDDYYLSILASESDFTADFLLTFFNNHLMPAPMAYQWWITHELGYVYWPYAAVMIVGQAVLSLLFLRLVRLVVRPGWGQLIPLAFFLFSPLNLETTSWWVFGMFMLPMELAMVWALIAQVRLSQATQAAQAGHRSRSWPHLISLGLAVLFGLLFAEKALLIAPLVFGFTACLLVKGGLGRSIWRALIGFWRSWAVLIVVCGAYLALYFTRAPEQSLRQPSSVDQVLGFYGQFFGDALLPGILGGPWTWLSDENGPPIVSQGTLLHYLAVIAFLGLIVFTIWRKASSGRAWVLFLGYAFLAATLIAATRMGAELSDEAGLTMRYVSDVALVGALCLGIALCGRPNEPRPMRIPVLRLAGPVALAVLAVGMVISTSGFATRWSAQPGREFLANARADLADPAKVPAGTHFFDLVVPDGIMHGFYYPANLQSRFLAATGLHPTFVTESEAPKMFDTDGHVRQLWVQGRNIVPGNEGACKGYVVKGGKVSSIKLDGPTLDWGWTVRMGYFATKDTRVTIRLGQGSHEFTARAGLHEIYFHLQGSGDTLQLQAADAGAELCTNGITVGNPSAWKLG